MKLAGCSNPYLPVEIIEQILLLLPPTSIGRWRCVSKQWRGLLSSPKFIESHASAIRTRALQTQSVSIFTYKTWFSFSLTNDNQVTASVAHHNLHLSRRTYLMGSCDGMVLVLVNSTQTLLINPTTHHTREIPTLIIHRSVDIFTANTMRVTLDGIGFDSVSNDYKVVSLIYNRRDDSSDEVFVHIYSINDGAWKSCISLSNVFGYRFLAHWPRGVFVGRCIHWLMRRDIDGYAIIVAFDVVEEKLFQVPIPNHHSFEHIPHKYCYRLGVLGGCLCVSTMIGKYLNVWVMKKYGIQESWTRIARIKIMKNGWFVPLCLVGQQNLVLEEYHIGKLNKLVSYNLADKMFKDVDIPADGMRDMDDMTISLADIMVSPYGMRGEC